MISSIRCGVGGPDLRLGDGVNVLIERGPVPVDVHDSDEFRGARFTHADLSGARMHDVDLSGARITDAMLVDESAAASSTSGPGAWSVGPAG